MIHVQFGPGELEAIVRNHGIICAAWECYSRWLTAYREANPADERSNMELTEVYAEEHKPAAGEGATDGQ